MSINQSFLNGKFELINQFKNHNIEIYQKHYDYSDEKLIIQNKQTIDDFDMQLTDEWICKIEINKYSLIESLNTSEQNYAMRKSLGDYKISILELFQHLMITSQSTNLQQSINLCPEIVETNSLINWLEKNFFQESSGAKLEIGRSKQQKYGIEEIQVRQEDEISIISPQYEGKATYNKDQIYEQQALSAFQQNGELQGSVSAFSNKTTLGCYFITNQVKIEKSVSIFMMGDEYDVKKNILMFVIRNIDVEIRKFKTNLEKTEQHRNVFYKYIKRIADDACQILQQVVQIKRGLDLRQKDFDKIKQGNFIALSFCDGDAFIKSEKVIGETKISQHLNIPYQQVVQNTTQRVTSSITQNADSQEEQFQKLYTISQTSDFIKQIEKWQYNLMLIEHNNFNFFEVFSSIEYEAHQFNFIKTLSIVKDIFKADSCIVKHNIMICQELHNENQMELISDKRRVKQVLINIIKNSIQCFDYNLSKKQSQNLTSLSTEQKQGMKQQEQKAQNIIVIKTWAHEDKINVEITDNGGGIKQEMLKNRPQDCKLGLKACEKILKSLSTDQNKPLEIVNYVKSKDGQSGTSVLFNLTKLFMSTVTTDENVFSDSLTIINKVLN